MQRHYYVDTRLVSMVPVILNRPVLIIATFCSSFAIVLDMHGLTYIYLLIIPIAYRQEKKKKLKPQQIYTETSEPSLEALSMLVQLP